MDAVHSVAEPRVVDLVKVVVKAGRVETDKAVIKLKRCTTGSPHLSLLAHKVLEMALNGLPQKDENLSIRALESPAILAKASDF